MVQWTNSVTQCAGNVALPDLFEKLRWSADETQYKIRGKGGKSEWYRIRVYGSSQLGDLRDTYLP